jgi:zinc and cadmium transporter
MNGFGLASQVDAEHEVARWLLPGLAIFLAIFLHKPADAMAISMVLSRKGVNRRIIGLVQLGFVLMVPVGAIAFTVAKHLISEELQKQLTGAALAFSAGTFVFIALSDLLPEVQFHEHDRLLLFSILVGAVLFMVGIAVLEDIGKSESKGTTPTKQEQSENPPGHDTSKEAEPGSHHNH